MFERFTKKAPLTGTIFNQPDNSDWLDEPVRKKNKSRENKVVTQNRILAYLVTREGKATQLQDIADAVGFGNTSSVSVLLGDLRRKKAVTRKGKAGRYTYRVNRTRVNKRKNGTATKVAKKQPERIAKLQEPVTPTNTDPLTPKQKRVLRYLASTNERLISQKEIARALKLRESGLQRFIRVLCEKGVLQRSGATVDGTRYRVVGESTKVRTEEPSPNRETQSENQSSSGNQNEHAFVDSLDSLVWEFVRATRSTDVLVFLTWMEQKVK